MPPILPQRRLVQDQQPWAQSETGCKSSALLLAHGQRQRPSMPQPPQIRLGQCQLMILTVEAAVVARAKSNLLVH